MPDESTTAIDHEVRVCEMDAIRAAEFFGLPSDMAAARLRALAAALDERGYDILGSEIDGE